jgi:hypothetical protein
MKKHAATPHRMLRVEFRSAVTARAATGFRLLSARMQRLHTLEPKSRANLEIAHGLHTREASK